MAIFERRENLPKSIDSGNIFVNFLLGGRILLVVLLTCAPGTSCSYSCVRMMRDTQAPEQASPVGARSSYASLTVLHAGLCSQYSVRFLLSTQFLPVEACRACEAFLEFEGSLGHGLSSALYLVTASRRI